MTRSGVAAAACLACLVAIPPATAGWSPPLLPGIAAEAGGAKLSVRCLVVHEWSAHGLPRGEVAVLRGRILFVTDHACSILVGYASAFPHVPQAGTPQELEVARTLFGFLTAAVSRLRLRHCKADCRVLESFVPALRALGAPSTGFAVRMRTRLLVARKRLHLEVMHLKGCPVKLPRAA